LQIENGTYNIKELKNKLSEQEFQANEVSEAKLLDVIIATHY
jgi:hypothetical protein